MKADELMGQSTNEELLCKARGHDWVNYMTYVPVRHGPLMSTACKRCGERATFPQNVVSVGAA